MVAVPLPPLGQTERRTARRVVSRLNNETRKTIEPDTPLKFDEVIFENLYLDLALSRQVSVKAGRQNLVRGEGFLFIEGNPLDGSRTAYFNAIDVTWSPVKDLKLELLGISNPDHDIYLPRINDKHKSLIEWDEEAIGFYATDRTRRGQESRRLLFLQEGVRRQPGSQPSPVPARAPGAHAWRPAGTDAGRRLGGGRRAGGDNGAASIPTRRSGRWADTPT